MRRMRNWLGNAWGDLARESRSHRRERNQEDASLRCGVPVEMHDHLRTVIVAPMTTKRRAAPFRIGVTHGGQKGLILLDQMRAVDKTRLAKKLGTVSAKTLTSTLNTLQEVFKE